MSGSDDEINDMLEMVPRNQKQQTQTAPSAVGRRAACISRYNDAYLVAATIVLVGKIIQWSALVVVGLALWMGYALKGYSNSPNVGVIVLGLMLAVLVFGFGIFVSANGQLLRASLDSAVHSSPFLDDDARAHVMGID